MIPKEIREDFARAKGYLRRSEVVRAMETMGRNLRSFTNNPALKNHSNAISALMYEFLNDLTFHPKMKCLLDPSGTGSPHKLIYTKGKEIPLATVLEGLARILREAEEAENANALNAKNNRFQTLIDAGEAHFKEGDVNKGNAYFNRAAAEFGKKEGVCIDLARRLTALEQHNIAAEIYILSIEQFPKNNVAYTEGIEAYIKSKEYAKAEEIYLKILKQFGGHANTYGHMAKLYLTWGKKYDASDFVLRALQLDATQADALEVKEILGE